VFAPSLFMGAMLGSAYGQVAHDVVPHLAPAAGAYGLVGMGAVFAAAARAPITSLLIIFELTGNYQIILPLMFAIAVATSLANAITHDNVYTLKLRRRGIDIEAPRAGLMAQIQVGAAMEVAPAPLRPEASLDEIVGRFATERSDCLPVVREDGGLVGVVAATDVERQLDENEHAPVLASTLVREAPRLHASDSLEDAIVALGMTDDEGLPVLGAGDDRMVGWLSHRQVLRAYRTRIAGDRAPAAGRPASIVPYGGRTPTPGDALRGPARDPAR
jgi:CIC family chloride channel protein